MRPLKFSPRTRAFLRVLLSHYITKGITACLGLLVISLIVENWLGAYAASLATVGVIAVTPPDVAAPRRGKLRTMMLPFIAGVPVFYIVQLLNGRHLELGILLTFFSFLAFLHRQPPARGRKCSPSEHALFQYRRRSLRHLGHAGQPGAQRPLPRAGHG